jgi:hypothetical protein
MSDIYKSEEGARLVEGRYRELLARWPIHCEQGRVSTPQGETFVVACGPTSARRTHCLDSKATTARLEQSAPNATVRVIADAGHVIRGKTATIAEFLAKGYELPATG